jgi:hypothetical protein
MNGASCKGTGVAGLSTIMKDLKLNGMSYYCDGSYVDTPTIGGTSPPRPSQPPKPSSPPKTSSTRIVPTPPQTSSSHSQPSTTKISTASPSRTSSTQRPTSTSGGGGGCRSKHWDQCGGQNWNGCTVCEVCVFPAMTVELSDSAEVTVYVQRCITAVLLSVSMTIVTRRNPSFSHHCSHLLATISFLFSIAIGYAQTYHVVM